MVLRATATKSAEKVSVALSFYRLTRLMPYVGGGTPEVGDYVKNQDNAIRAQMQLHGVGRETARYWVFSAADSSE